VVVQPRRVDTDGGDVGGFAHWDVSDDLRLVGDITLDLGIELLCYGSDPLPRAAERDPLVQRQHLLEQRRGLPVGKIGGPFDLEVLQFGCDALGQRFAQRTHGNGVVPQVPPGNNTTTISGS
jgi:hypothetical protein